MKPLIIQSDMTILLEVDNPQFVEARNFLILFAEIVKSPEFFHTYKLTQLSLWNALGALVTSEDIIEGLKKYSKHQVPELVISQIEDICERYGRVKLVKEGDSYVVIADQYIINQIINSKEVGPLVINRISNIKVEIDKYCRGEFKRRMIRLSYPVDDTIGYLPSTPLPFSLKTDFTLRYYQKEAADIFYDEGRSSGGSGVITLPCGSGKTIVGIAIMEKVQTETLILTTSTTAVRQWINELQARTTIDPLLIGEYTGDKKEIRPVTVSTYQIMSSNRDGVYSHYDLFNDRNWGLIIYDEVHTLPAPVFQVTSQMQSKRRLGLTATLVREDGLERDVFCLIGSKKYDLSWKALEDEGFIASVSCIEYRIPLPECLKMDYSVAEKREKFRIASENPDKIKVIDDLLELHRGEKILIIGQYIKQLEAIRDHLQVPLITGTTKNSLRGEIYEQFRSGDLDVLILSKVGNFAIDLPNASVAIEVSGTYGSRQEEAQRVGRILRPKDGANRSVFYTLVSADTDEQLYATKRQLFMIEQGYRYQINNKYK